MHLMRPIVVFMLLVPMWLSSQNLPVVTAADQAAPPTDAPAADAPAKDTPAGENATPDDAAAAAEKSLAGDQDLIARRYRRFEETLLKIAEVMRKSDPDRATLLIRAIGKSREERVAVQLTELIGLLQEEQFGDASERQTEVVTQLQGLLDLLLSEDRAKELAAEKARLQKHIKELNKIIAQQKDVRAGTERGDPAERLTDRQKKVTERTGDLGKQIDKEDTARRDEAKEGEEDSSESGDKPGDKSGDKPEDKPADKSGKPDGEKPDGEKPDAESGKPSEGGKPQPGQPQPGESQPSPPQDATPGREEIERARQQMENAIQKLKQKQREGASDHQDEAIRELVRAKEKLEEILRQLREEERARLLANLESRFQRMLAMQIAVYDGTVKLHKVPVADRTGAHHSRSLQFARQEDEIALEATKALTLLREEGTAIVFPEAVEQMRDDMRLVVRRLERTEVGDLTQSIEKDIIDALGEMIEALQKEMEKSDRKSQQDQGKGEPQDPALVDQLSELKMLRSLQLRINHRTKRLGRAVDGEQAQDPDIVSQLQNLSDRQARIQQRTYDLVTGKNK